MRYRPVIIWSAGYLRSRNPRPSPAARIVDCRSDARLYWSGIQTRL